MAPSGQPGAARVVVATVLSVAGSLVADAVLVKLATTVFPSTKGFSHFRFSDYATLTTLGVVAACASWPVVTRLTSAPRWLFFRLAVVVTLLLWLPDLALLAKGELPRAVAVLMVMHLAIALVTYPLLVRIAPPRPAAEAGHPPAGAGHPHAVTEPPITGPAAPPAVPGGRRRDRVAPAISGYTWIGMLIGIGVEFILGLGALLIVPLGRPDEWIPSRGQDLYLAHAVLGAVLAVAAALILVTAARGGRLTRIGGWTGLVGLALGGGGGVLAVFHPLRIVGIGLMFLAPAVAMFGYVMPLVELSRERSSARRSA
jgi:hypothetical protein